MARSFARCRRAVRGVPGLVFALALGATALGCAGSRPATPEEPRNPPFLSIEKVDPTIRLDIRYAGADNFVGAPIDGYQAASCLLTVPAVDALVAAQAEVRDQGLSLLVYDCYRPQRAVDRFLRWASDLADQRTKEAYYPRVAKDALVAKGYIAARSAHSRGSTVDLTLVQLDSWGGAEPLDMGTSFDFFDPSSHTDSTEVSPEARRNRRLLRDVMERHGFRNLPTEWWHYTLVPEPYPDRGFDVPVR
jgi:D-alanyl-D-alanine dipeptidase